MYSIFATHCSSLENKDRWRCQCLFAKYIGPIRNESLSSCFVYIPSAIFFAKIGEESAEVTFKPVFRISITCRNTDKESIEISFFPFGNNIQKIFCLLCIQLYWWWYCSQKQNHRLPVVVLTTNPVWLE